MSDVVNVKLRGEGDVTCAFSNEPPWPSLADGKGRTLVYLGGNSAQANSWGASADVGGNPGVGGDQALKPAQVRINEIKPFVSNADHSWLELYNMGDEEVNLSGWTVEVKLRKDTLTIKEGTVIPAKGYLVLDGVEAFDNELVVANQGGEFYLRGLQVGEESSLWVPANTGTSGVIDLADGFRSRWVLFTLMKFTTIPRLREAAVLNSWNWSIRRIRTLYFIIPQSIGAGK